MRNPLDENLQATVTRYTIGRIQRIPLLIPIAIVASALARRLPGILTLGIALAVLLAFGLVLRSAVTRIGMQTVRVDRDAVWIGTDVSVPRSAILRWTFSKGVATLLCQGTSYRLRSKQDREAGLEDCLRSLLGAPTMLQKRGSPKARLIAGCGMMSGLVAAVSGITFESMPLVVIGIPSVLIGFGFFATLSSRRIAG